MKKIIAIAMSLIFALSFVGCEGGGSEDPNRNTKKYVYPTTETVFKVGKIDKELKLEDDWSPLLKDENAIYVIKNEDNAQEVKDKNYLSGKVFGMHDGKKIYFYGIVNDKTPMLNLMDWASIFRGDAIELAFANVKGANLKKNSPGKYFKYIFAVNSETGEKIADGRRSSGVVNRGPQSLTYMFEKYPDGKGYFWKAIIDTTKKSGYIADIDAEIPELTEFLDLTKGVTECYFGMFIDNSTNGKALDDAGVANVMWTGHANRSAEFNKMVFER